MWAAMEACFPSFGRCQLVKLLLSFNFLLFTRVLGSWNISSVCLALGNISSPVTIPDIPLSSFFSVTELTKILNAVNVNLKRSNLMYARQECKMTMMQGHKWILNHGLRTVCSEKTVKVHSLGIEGGVWGKAVRISLALPGDCLTYTREGSKHKIYG